MILSDREDWLQRLRFENAVFSQQAKSRYLKVGGQIFYLFDNVAKGKEKKIPSKT